MSMKKRRWLLFYLITLLLLLAACGGGESPTGTDTTGADTTGAETPTGGESPTGTEATGGGEQQQLQLLGWASSDAENSRLSQVVQTFGEQNEQFDATFNPVPEYDAALQTALAGSPPDLFYVNADNLPNLASQGALAPLGDVIENPDDFYQPMVQAFTYEGELYGIPKDFSVLALIYNTEMFEAAGISEPPTSWEELRGALEQLSEAGQPPMCAAATIDRWGVFALQAGDNFLSEDRSTATFNSPGMIEGLTFYTDLVLDGLAVPHGQLDADWCGAALGSGRASVTIEGNWVVPFLRDNFPDIAWDVAELPAGPAGKGTWAFTAAYGISPQAPNPEGSRALLQYLTSPEGMWEWTSLGLAMPTRSSLAEQWAEQFPELEPFISSGEFATVRPTAVGFPDVIRELEAEVQAIFAGSQTPEGALENVQQIAEQALERNQ